MSTYYLFTVPKITIQLVKLQPAFHKGRTSVLEGLLTGMESHSIREEIRICLYIPEHILDHHVPPCFTSDWPEGAIWPTPHLAAGPTLTPLPRECSWPLLLLLGCSESHQSCWPRPSTQSCAVSYLPACSLAVFSSQEDLFLCSSVADTHVSLHGSPLGLCLTQRRSRFVVPLHLFPLAGSIWPLDQNRCS